MLRKIRKHRLIQINSILDNFDNLPPTLQTEKYKKYLLSTKDSLLPHSRQINIPTNKIGIVIGPKGSTIRHLEKEYNCDIFIKDNTCLIEGNEADEVVKFIEDLLSTNKVFIVEKMTDWEKFYVWWSYHNKQNI